MSSDANIPSIIYGMGLAHRFTSTTLINELIVCQLDAFQVTIIVDFIAREMVSDCFMWIQGTEGSCVIAKYGKGLVEMIMVQQRVGVKMCDVDKETPYVTIVGVGLSWKVCKWRRKMWGRWRI